MGATTFVIAGHGSSPEDAFKRLKEIVARDVGRGGYSGTIVEKDSFIMINCPSNKDPRDYAYDLIATNDPRIPDKWGPACCIVIRPAKKEATIETKKITNLKDMPLFKPVYVVYEGTKNIGTYPTLQVAKQKAEDYTKTHFVPTVVKKEMINSQNILYSVSPKNREECLGEYLFFGWSPC